MRVAIARTIGALGIMVVAVVAAFFGKVYWDRVSEGGYVAFNAERFAEARNSLTLMAYLGDPSAQKLMSYMCGLGLGGPVDIGGAMRWMNKGVPFGADSRGFIGEQAYYLGKSAVDGHYGADKIEVGRLWLRIAELSGSEKARSALGP
jgi:hypothetical protein